MLLFFRIDVKERDAMEAMLLYKNAHLFVSAVRILEHRHSAPPAIEDVCAMLSISPEQGHYLCRKLTDYEIIEIVDSAYGPRLFVKDHLKIEKIPREKQEDRFQEALKEFQTSRKSHTQKVKAIQMGQQRKKQDLFADLEKQLKKNLGKK
jgi:hypothetical protein